VLLYKDWAVLYTQRLQVQPIIILFSNLSGAIVGILGLFGFIMGIFEGKYTDYKNKKSNMLRVRNIRINRERIFLKNFIEDQGDIYHTRSPESNAKVLQISEDKSLTDYRNLRLYSEEACDSSVMKELPIFDINH